MIRRVLHKAMLMLRAQLWGLDTMHIYRMHCFALTGSSAGCPEMRRGCSGRSETVTVILNIRTLCYMQEKGRYFTLVNCLEAKAIPV